MIWNLLKVISKKQVILEKPNGADNSGNTFFNLEANLINGTTFHFEQLKDKKTLIVNTASNCGFISQLAALEELSNLYKDKLTVLGFPCNDFLKQEPKNNTEISDFCKINYQISFPLFEKITLKKRDISSVYQWLSSKNLNGWNTQKPDWNFCKYLIDENGQLVLYTNSRITPNHPSIISKIEH